MNDVTLIYQGIESVDFENKLLSFVDMVFSDLKINNWEISLTICDNNYIQNINKEYRNKDKPTDVITFVMSDEPFPVSMNDDEPYSAGDMIISLETIKENSEYFKVSYEEELKRVIIHGILHLKGMDHETNDPTEEMLIIQERMLKDMNKVGIF